MQLTLSKSISDSPAGQASVVFGFAALTALGAQIEVPMYPVPITMQTAMVLLSGAFIGARLGALSQALYLIGGLALPIYAGGATGIDKLFGASGGYLLSFPFTAALAGWLVGNERNGIRLFACIFIASLPTLFLGAVWLKFSLVLNWSDAVAVGIVPFIIGDILKCSIVAAATATKARLIK